ncbi:MAG: low temperature requirement protein A [Chloroflexota bacterium]
MSDLFTRPRYFKDVTFHRHTDRSVGWLELFYDLVYVATLIQIGNFLSDNLTLVGFGQFLVLMFLIWWAWAGETGYQTRYYVDDIWHRLLVFVQIMGIATVGLSVSEAFGDLSVQFALGYALARSMMIVMYIRAYFSHPASRSFSTVYIIAFGGEVAIWLGSTLLPAEYRWIAWLVAIAFQIIFFAVPTTLREAVEWGPDDHHMVERFGIFTIIVLGEAFVKILNDAQGTQLAVEQVLFGVAGLTILYSLWWLYFSDTAGKLYDLSSEAKALSWSYGHLFLATSLVAFAVAMKKLFAANVAHPHDLVKDEYRLLLTVAIGTFLLAQALIDYGLDDELTPHSTIKRVYVYLGSIAVVVGIGSLVTGVTAMQFTTIIAVMMAALVVFNVYQSLAIAAQQPEH